METLSIISVLMERDGLNLTEANEVLKDCRNQVLASEDPEEVLQEIGLKPDYIFDLL